jgi:DNA-binding transcriptional LysR family regulator
MQVQELRWFVAAVHTPNPTRLSDRLHISQPAHPGAPASPPLLSVSDAGAERSIGLAWHRERYRSPAAVAFADFVVARPRR